MKVWLMLVLILPLWGSRAAQLEPKSKVTYFASAGDGKVERWSGSGPLESLELKFDPSRPLASSFKAVMLPDRFDSGNGIRDANARGNLFQTHLYPQVVLTSLALAGDARAMRVGESRDFQVRAALSLHQVTRELGLLVRATWDGVRLKASSSFVVNMDDHKMPHPNFLVLNVDRTVRLEVKLEALPD